MTSSKCETRDRQAYEYVKKIESSIRNDPETARKEATSTLIRMGVLSSDGKPKKKIVSWE